MAAMIDDPRCVDAVYQAYVHEGASQMAAGDAANVSHVTARRIVHRYHMVRAVPPQRGVTWAGPQGALDGRQGVSGGRRGVVAGRAPNMRGKRRRRAWR